MPEVLEPRHLSEDMLVEFFKRLQIRPRNVGKEKVVIGIKTSTVRTYWSKLFSYFKWLESKGYILRNPLQSIKPPYPEYVDDRALEEKDLQKILAAISLNPSQGIALKRDFAMFHVLIFCGLRKNEFLSLQITDINLEKRELTVRAPTSKSKKTRIIPLHLTPSYHLKEYLQERKKRGDTSMSLWVHSSRDAPFTSHGLKHWIIRLSKLSGIKFHLHQFRHSFACALAKKDVNPIKIQKLMGHANIKMTMTYLRSLSPEDFRDDIEKMSF